MSDAYDWVFDYALQFLESDLFDAAVMDFVDEKCDVFDSEEENKFVYSDIHAEFRDHIEALITSNLGEVGITVAMFYESCEKGRGERDINRAVFERMLAMEDFSTFKRIMVKRNTELQLMALAGGESSAESTPVKSSAGLMHMISSPMSPEEEKEQLDRAINNSMSQSLKREEVVAKVEKIESDNMQEMLRNSLLEMELLHRREEMEQAELEKAMAESLALEEERISMMQRDVGAGADADADAGAGAGAKDGHVRDVKGVDTSSFNDSARGGGDVPRDTALDVADAKGGPSDQLLMSMSKNEADDSFGESVDTIEGSGVPSSSGSSKPRKKVKPGHQGAESKSSLPPPKPLKPLKGLGLSRGAALPPIRAGAGHDTPDDRERQLKALSDMERELETKRREAEQVIRQGQQQRAEQRAQEQKMRQELEAVLQQDDGGDVDKREAELERRAAQMKAQRDRLVAMKKAERAQKVAEEEERNAKKNDEVKSRMLETAPTDFLEQQRRKEGLEEKEAGYGGPSKEEIEEGRRGAMRNALARRMKMNLVLGEEERVARAQHEQLLDLEKKLNDVELLRNDSRAVSTYCDDGRDYHDTLQNGVAPRMIFVKSIVHLKKHERHPYHSRLI